MTIKAHWVVQAFGQKHTLSSMYLVCLWDFLSFKRGIHFECSLRLLFFVTFPGQCQSKSVTKTFKTRDF